MRTFVLLLTVLVVAVAASVALPYIERDDETELSQAILGRVRRSPLPEDSAGAARPSSRGKTGVSAGGNGTRVAGGQQSGTKERQGGIAWDIKW